MGGWPVRWTIVLVSMGVVLAVLFGGQVVYKKMGVERPVRGEILASGVAEQVALQRVGDRDKVCVQLKPGVDLCEAYRCIELALGSRADSLDIEITNRSEEKFLPVWYHIQYTMYEAAARGNFSEAARGIVSLARQNGMEARFWVDEKRLYLELRSGEDHFYKVIERSDMTGREG